MTGGVLGGLSRFFGRKKIPRQKQICISNNEADVPGKFMIPRLLTILDLSGLRPFGVSTHSLQDLSTKSILPLISSLSLCYLDPILALAFFFIWP